jgi:hypothetical protein
VSIVVCRLILHSLFTFLFAHRHWMPPVTLMAVIYRSIYNRAGRVCRKTCNKRSLQNGACC